MKKIQACIFDLDGTLVDSMWIWPIVDAEYLKRYSIDCPADLTQAVAGMSFTETAMYFKERFGLSDSVEEIKKDWENMALHLYEKKVPLKNGVREFLSFLKDRGIKTGIATSNGMKMVDAVLDALHIRESFDTILTACNVNKGKPSPDIYLAAGNRLGVSEKECLVFEDIPEGILAGKNAGMEVVAIEDSFSEHLREEKIRLADHYIKDYFEIFSMEHFIWYE